MSLTGRPSRPALALVSSSQIFMPSSACLPKPASGPVSAMPKPIVIGWPDSVCACVDFRNATTATAARREGAVLRHFGRASMVSSAVGFVEPFTSSDPWLLCTQLDQDLSWLFFLRENHVRTNGHWLTTFLTHQLTPKRVTAQIHRARPKFAAALAPA